MVTFALLTPSLVTLFFVGKKDGKLCPVVNYQKLNSFTIPNQYPLPFIQKGQSQDSLQNQYRTLQTHSNVVWIQNAPLVFQKMMNTQFANLTVTDQVIIYMNNILPATEDNSKKHRELVHKVLESLAKLDLHLKPSKCQFEVQKLKFLGVALEGGTVTMDPIKVSGLQE